MSVTTIKRCQSDSLWWYHVEDYNVEGEPDPGTGLTITYFDEHRKEGNCLLCVSREDALLLRDAINQLYPPS
tara:strand:+ start:803 stop:1018 length:216 start_codon:yes stop_codon:yes gene_type:complete